MMQMSASQCDKNERRVTPLLNENQPVHCSFKPCVDVSEVLRRTQGGGDETELPSPAWY